MSLGDFVAFNIYILMLTWPIIALGWVINIFQRGTASMGRINEILVAQPEITDAAVAADVATSKTFAGEIEFRNLNFAYNGVPVLKDDQPQDPSRQQPGDCRPDWFRQDHAGEPAAANL